MTPTATKVGMRHCAGHCYLNSARSPAWRSGCPLGGEEFAVILPETAGSSGAAMAERLREAIANQAIAITQEQITSLTASMGLAYPKSTQAP